MTDASLDVRVIPRAHKTELAGERDGALLVRLAAPPVEGAANAALNRLPGLRAGSSPPQPPHVSGERSRRKRVAIAGMTTEQVRAILRR